MAEVVVLKAVLTGDHSNLSHTLQESRIEIQDFVKEDLGSHVVRVRVDRRELDTFERDRNNALPDSSSGSSPRLPRPSTQNPERIAKTTAAAVEQVEKTSQSRQTAIVAEGEAKRASIAAQSESKRASIEQQGAQRRANAQSAADARLEANERAHLQRLIQDKERAEQRLAMKPRMTLAQKGEQLSSIGGTLNSAGNTLTMGVTAPVVAGGALVLREGMKWETSLAEMKRTIGGSQMQRRALEMQLRDMAAGKNAIPLSQNELAGLASEAGAMGVSRKNIPSFVRSGAELGVATNMQSGEAANFLARFTNASGGSQNDFDRLGSSLVALGQQSPATESEIAEMSLRIAGMGKQIGLTQPQVLGFAAALSGVGIRSQEGGTAISMSFEKMDTAVREGGKELDGIAKVAGMSAAQFKKAWQEDAASAMVAFIAGLKRTGDEGGSAAGTLDALGFKGREIHDTLLRASNASDTFTEAIKTGGEAWRQNTALMDAANTRYQTGASQIEILKNRLRELALQASETALPTFNKELQGFSAGIPDDAKTAGAAYDALGPAGQKAVIGLVGIGVASGPIMKVAGSVISLLGALVKLGDFVLPISLTKGLASLGPLLSDPLIAIPLLVAALGLGAIAWQNYKAKIDDVLIAHHNAEMGAQTLASALERAQKYAGGSAATKSALGKLQQDAKDAGQDTGKLIALIKKATDEKVTVGKDMKLDPLGKNAVQQELQRFINALTSQVVTLHVNVDTGRVDPAIQAAVDKARGTPSTPDVAAAGRETDWQARAKRAGVTLPAQPQRKIKGSYSLLDGLDSHDYTYDNPNYEKEVEARTQARQKIIDIEKAQAAAQSHAATATKSTTQAINEQTQAVSKLTDAELAHEKKRLEGILALGKLGLGSPEYPRSLEVKSESDKRAAAARNKPKGKPKITGTTTPDKNATAQAESVSDQARADAEKSLSQQASDLNRVQSQFEGQLSRVSQLAEEGAQSVGEMGEKTARAKAQAETLRDEWNGTSQAIKDSHIEMAGLEVQLSKLNGLTQSLRQGFDQIAQGLSDADFEKFSSFVSKVEGNLNLGGQRAALLNRANQLAGNVMPTLKGAQDSLDTQRSALQLSGRKGFDNPKDPTDGNLGTVLSKVSGNDILAAAQKAHAGAMPAFQQTCAWAVSKIYDTMGVELKTQNNNWAANLVNYARKNWKQVDAASAPAGALLAEPSPTANSGWHVTVSRGGLNRAGSNHKRLQTGMAGRNALAFVPPELLAGASGVETPKPVYDPRQNWPFAKQIKLVDPKTGLLPWEAAQNAQKPVAGVKTTYYTANTSATQSGDYIPAYQQNNELLDRMRLPKSFGGSMAQYRAKDGESTSYRQQMEQQLHAVLQAADELKPQKDGTVRARFGKQWENVSPWDWRQEGGRLDSSKTQFDQRTGGINQVRDAQKELAKRRALAGNNSEFAGLIESMNQGGYRGTTTSERQNVLAKTAGAILAEATAANKDFSKSEKEKQDALAAGRPFLQGANSDLAGYARALALAEEKQQALQRYKPLEDSAKAALQKAEELEAAAKKANAAAEVQEKAAQKYMKAGRLMEAFGPQRQAEKFRTNATGFASQASQFRGQAAGFLDARDKNVAGDVASAAKSFDASALQEAQKALDATLVARRQNIELLQFQNKLLLEGKLSQEAIEDATEGEKIYREELKKLIDSTQYNTPEQLAAMQEQARGAANQRVKEKGEERKGGNLTDDANGVAESRRQIALLQRKLELAQQYPSGSPQLEYEKRMAEARSELMGQYEKNTDSKGNLDPAKQPEFDKRLLEREKQIRAQMALETKEAEIHAVEDAKIATLSAQKEVLEATETNFEKRLALEKKFENDSRAIRGQNTMTPDEESEMRKRAEYERQSDVLRNSRQQAEQLSDIYAGGIETGMHKGIVAGLKQIAQDIQQAILKQGIQRIADDLAGVPRDPNSVGIMDILLGRKRNRSQGNTSQGEEDGNATDTQAGDTQGGNASSPQYDNDPRKYGKSTAPPYYNDPSKYGIIPVPQVVTNVLARHGSTGQYTPSQGGGAGKGMTLDNVREITVLRSDNTDVSGQQINVSDNQSLFGGGRGGSGSSARTTPSLEQMIYQYRASE